MGQADRDSEIQTQVCQGDDKNREYAQENKDTVACVQDGASLAFWIVNIVAAFALNKIFGPRSFSSPYAEQIRLQHVDVAQTGYRRANNGVFRSRWRKYRFG
jgi:hypothetical protein